MIQTVAIAAGGAVGALMRFWASRTVVAIMGTGFPYGTLIVNVSGSFLMGFLYVLLLERMSIAPEWRAALLIGVLGAFTTFSTFSIETILLFEQGSAGKAVANMLVSVLACVVAAWFGVLGGRSL
ncbi:MAG: fluoride efflux transporter CrcB [Gammaproteobacteria bacterium]|nr:MAG: fluoride efflux transporter CrcB [Gammaproteobacteria bacterium]